MDIRRDGRNDDAVYRDDETARPTLRPNGDVRLLRSMVDNALEMPEEEHSEA